MHGVQAATGDVAIGALKPMPGVWMSPASCISHVLSAVHGWIHRGAMQRQK